MKNKKKFIFSILSYMLAFALTVLSINISSLVLPTTAEPVYASSYSDNYWKRSNVYDINSLKKKDESEYPNAYKPGYTKTYVNETPIRLYYADWWEECPNCGRDTYHCSFAAWGYRDANGNEYVLISSECNHCEGHNGYPSCGHGGTAPSLDGKYGTVLPGSDRKTKVQIELWLPNSYIVTFNAGNGQAASTCTVIYDSTNSNTGVISASLTGNILQGWYTGTNGTGEKVYDADGNAVNGSYWSGNGGSAIWKGTSSLTLYAYWKTIDYTQTLYFYKDGTVDRSKTKTYQIEYGATFKISDYYDVSMSPFANCHHVSTSKSSWTVTKAASANIYYAANELDIIYNGNGSTSGSTAGTSVKYGSTVTVAQNSFTRTGYSFVNWNTRADGSGTAYVPGAAFTAQPKTHGEDMILYAVWKDVTNPTVSTVPASMQTWTHSQSVTITAADNDSLGSTAMYEYCLCANDQTPDGNWTSYKNGTPFTIGSELSGAYYLWVRAVSDVAGNVSSQTGYHKFGPYYFDNAAPDLSSVKNTYGWFDSGSRPEIDFDITDTESGIKSIVINDVNDVALADITGGTHRFRFDANGINFYNVIATDNLDNVSKKMFAVKIGTSEVPAENSVWKGLNNLVLYQSWLPITYTIRFDKNDSDSTTAATGTMADVPAVYDAPLNLPENKFARDGYEFMGWNTKADGSGIPYHDKEIVINLTDEVYSTVTLYAQWNDISAPVIVVTPTQSINPDVADNAVRSIDVTISIAETGSGLSPGNSYEYGFSNSFSSPPDNWTAYCSSAADYSFSTMLSELGSSYTGYYYLWLRQISDKYGNLSVSDGALGIIDSCHVYGIYIFDNSAPSGTAKYIENNSTLGLYNDVVTDTPYAVMKIYDAQDDIAGIAGYTLVISDAENTDNTAEFDFVEIDGNYSCRFNLYDCLSDYADVRTANMCINAYDLLGNSSTIPISSYDFGTMQYGLQIRAEDIGFLQLNNPSDYYYSRDYFRVEAYIENISHNSHGTSFMGGHKGRLRIYTFGSVHSFSADFGSVKKYVTAGYDIHPNLNRTIINPAKTAYIYLHDFFIPLSCAPSTYTDTMVSGYKKDGLQHRNVIYDVDGALTDNIKTILKYNAN